MTGRRFHRRVRRRTGRTTRRSWRREARWTSAEAAEELHRRRAELVRQLRRRADSRGIVGHGSWLDRCSSDWTALGARRESPASVRPRLLGGGGLAKAAATGTAIVVARRGANRVQFERNREVRSHVNLALASHIGSHRPPLVDLISRAFPRQVPRVALLCETGHARLADPKQSAPALLQQPGAWHRESKLPAHRQPTLGPPSSP
jgi:hypothetical protein